jgi:hypothetical protein
VRLHVHFFFLIYKKRIERRRLWCSGRCTAHRISLVAL